MMIYGSDSPDLAESRWMETLKLDNENLVLIEKGPNFKLPNFSGSGFTVDHQSSQVWRHNSVDKVLLVLCAGSGAEGSHRGATIQNQHAESPEPQRVAAHAVTEVHTIPDPDPDPDRILTRILTRILIRDLSLDFLSRL